MRLGPRDRAAAVLLALAVLLGAMPLTLGVTVERDHGPAFTLNICHPPHGFDRSPVPVIAVMPEHTAIRTWLSPRGRVGTPAPCLHQRAADAPDPPPPKTRASERAAL